MTRFERDLQEALNGDEIAVLCRRQKEMEDLILELIRTKNPWRAQCIKQELRRLQDEHDQILAQVQAQQ